MPGNCHHDDSAPLGDGAPPAATGPSGGAPGVAVEISPRAAIDPTAAWPAPDEPDVCASGDPEDAFDDLVSAPPSGADVALAPWLGPEGRLATFLPGFERRAGQEAMMRAVLDALDRRRVALIEAGTGTGKSLGYLLPAVVSGLRVIIATGTRTLQDQLHHRQIPFVRDVLGLRFTAAVLKGRTNYLCRLLLEQAGAVPDLALDLRAGLERIRVWAAETETGDRAELVDAPEVDRVWRAVAADEEQCLHRRCPRYDSCFLMAARRRAASADVVIVNHHLLFADLALSEGRDTFLLPDADAVILDEAHHVEDVAALAFGTQVSDARHRRLGADLRRALLGANRLGAEAEQLLSSYRLDVDAFWAPLRGAPPRTPFSPAATGPAQRDAYARLDNRLIELALFARRVGAADEALQRIAERAEALRADTFALAEAPDGAAVRWLDAGPRATFLRSAPISVAEDLGRTLYRRYPRVIFTSATLAAGEGNGFELMVERLGAITPETLRVPSPFDYPEQAMLFLPADLPPPSHADWLRCAVPHIEALVELTRGRALILFTSYQKMRDAHALLAPRWRWPVLIQGEGGRDALLQRFKALDGGVLFATQSFWEGVDIPGEALSLVIIDKLPFQSPGDPLVDARLAALRRAGRNPFTADQVPRAGLALKQGLGRLIRHRSDRGIAAILDPRVLRAGYGAAILASLPSFSRTSDFDEVRAFWVRIERQRSGEEESPP